MRRTSTRFLIALLAVVLVGLTLLVDPPWRGNPESDASSDATTAAWPSDVPNWSRSGDPTTDGQPKGVAMAVNLAALLAVVGPGLLLFYPRFAKLVSKSVASVAWTSLSLPVLGGVVFLASLGQRAMYGGMVTCALLICAGIGLYVCALAAFFLTPAPSRPGGSARALTVSGLLLVFAVPFVVYGVGFLILLASIR